jgi:hypothetical protein
MTAKDYHWCAAGNDRRPYVARRGNIDPRRCFTIPCAGALTFAPVLASGPISGRPSQRHLIATRSMERRQHPKASTLDVSDTLVP